MFWVKNLLQTVMFEAVSNVLYVECVNILICSIGSLLSRAPIHTGKPSDQIIPYMRTSGGAKENIVQNIVLQLQ